MSPSDREAEAWDRLGRMAALSLVQSLAELVNEAPPGGIWGREADVHVEVLPKAEAACRAHTERLLFQHPSFGVTGGSCRWAETPQQPLVEGYVCLRVFVRWPRFEDSPLVKGTTDGKPLGLRFSPEMVPTIEAPRSIDGDGWKDHVRGADAVEPCAGCGALLPDPRQGFVRCPVCDVVACSPFCLARHRRDRHDEGRAP